MMAKRTHRRLAAIMAADVVGYSRLMGVDEAGTLAALKELRKDIFAPQVADHRGRIVKLIGDGALVEFASVVDSVSCAVEIQSALLRRNAERTGQEPIELRIGINLGDVIIEGTDIYGDGVNVAARLQEVSMPGEVVLSATAHEHAKGKIDVEFADAGELLLKNIAAPVRVYRWSYKPRLDGALTEAKPVVQVLPDKPSIAVLAFDNMSGDPEQECLTSAFVGRIIGYS